MNETDTWAWLAFCHDQGPDFLDGIGSYLVWVARQNGNDLYQADGEWMLLMDGHCYMVASLLADCHSGLVARTLHLEIALQEF